MRSNTPAHNDHVANVARNLWSQKYHQTSRPAVHVLASIAKVFAFSRPKFGNGAQV
jgi:hypothetical protein